MIYKGICPECREMEFHDLESVDTVRCPKCEKRVTLEMHPDMKERIERRCNE